MLEASTTAASRRIPFICFCLLCKSPPPYQADRYPANENPAGCDTILDMSTSLPARAIPPDWFLRRRLKLRQLALLIALVEHQGLRRAAAAMSLTQPAATKLLRETESMVGVALFERLPRGMRPTPYGLIMVRHARSVLTALDRAREEIAALASGSSGTIAVGSVRGAAPSLLAPALAATRRSQPRVRLHVMVDASEIVIPQLRDGRLDLVLGGVPAPLAGRDLSFEPLLDEPLAVVARPEHPLASTRRLSWRELGKAEWIMHPQESPLRPLLEKLSARAPNLIETASVIATTMLLEQSDMLGILPLDVADHYAERGLIAILRVRLPVTLERIGIVTHADRALSPAAEEFVQEVRRIASGYRSRPRSRSQRRSARGPWSRPPAA
jgi:DNA-binding transcriptional LysR family regulator